MPEFTIPEVASPAKCLNIFWDRVEHLVKTLPINELARFKIFISPIPQEQTSEKKKCLLEVDMEIGSDEYVYLKGIGFFDSFYSLIEHYNGIWTKDEISTRRGTDIFRHTVIEFLPYQSTELIRALSFEEDFDNYIARKYNSPQLALIESRRSAVKIVPYNNEGDYRINGQVKLLDDPEISDVVLFRDLNSERDEIVEDLTKIANVYNGKLTVVMRDTSTIVFEIAFK